MVPLDAEEAARQFWNKKTNVARELEDASLVAAVPVYSEALQPTVDALNNICDHIVGAMEGVLSCPIQPNFVYTALVTPLKRLTCTGWDEPVPEPPRSEGTEDSVSKSVISMHSSAEKKSVVEKTDCLRGVTVRRSRTADTCQGSSNAADPKLLHEAGTVYVSAMKKATRCAGVDPPSVKILPSEFKQANTQAVKFLDLLKGQTPKRGTETPGVGPNQGRSSMPQALARWTSRKDEEPSEGLQRSLPVLAGPAFNPNHWFQGSYNFKNTLEVAEEAKAAEEKLILQGPDVSGFPRPSDRLAFAHLEETGAPAEQHQLSVPGLPGLPGICATA